MILDALPSLETFSAEQPFEKVECAEFLVATAGYSKDLSPL